MSLNRVKVGRAVTFMKYLARVVSLIFLAKTFIRNKITFPASNYLNLAELVVNEPSKMTLCLNEPLSIRFITA